MSEWSENVMKFMMSNQEVALLMQEFMTIVEVCITLALVAGLFTRSSSTVTIGLTVAFCLSDIFYWVNIWFISVALALMSGSGHAVGLGCWVIPWIRRKLGKAWHGTLKARYGGK